MWLIDSSGIKTLNKCKDQIVQVITSKELKEKSLLVNNIIVIGAYIRLYCKENGKYINNSIWKLFYYICIY